jgi:hypothetical protein
MATKKTAPAPAPAPVTTDTVLDFNPVAVRYPFTYKLHKNFGVMNDEGYKNLPSGRDPVKTIAALRQAADLLEKNPGLLLLDPSLTPALLREQADLIEHDQEVKRALEAASTKATQLRRLNAADAAGSISSITAQLNVQARKDPSLRDLFSAITDLTKRT